VDWEVAVLLVRLERGGGSSHVLSLLLKRRRLAGTAACESVVFILV
jgi:hypothetical protein